ncbi:MAG TPA: phosphoribosylglycinamide formyltransferase [Myxococcota bacterium]|nr:phosphoribosylglycinamide formyltransferase [Myxococcota bacterium]
MSGQAVIELIAAHIAPKKRARLLIGVLASNNGSNLQALIDFAKTPGSYFSISSVISNNPTSYALVRAKEASIRGHLIDHKDYDDRRAFDDQLAACLNEDGAELIVCAGFLRVLKRKFLRQFHQRVINLHPSLLPKHRGLHAIEKALQAGDAQTGCTVHLVDSGLDTGPIIAQSTCPISATDSLEDVTNRIQALEHVLLSKVVNQIAKVVVTRDCV